MKDDLSQKIWNVLKWELPKTMMVYHGIDSRGDGVYYCPVCGEGGSFMGIIREEDIPTCNKTHV